MPPKSDPTLRQQNGRYAWRVNFRPDWRSAEWSTVVVVLDEPPVQRPTSLPAAIERAVMTAYPDAYIWSGECVGPVLAQGQERTLEGER